MNKFVISLLLMIPTVAQFQCVELSVSGWPTSQAKLDSLNIYADTGNRQFAKVEYTPQLDSVTYYYTADVKDSVIRIQPFAQVNSIYIDYRHTPSGYWSNDIALSYGLNTLKIKVRDSKRDPSGESYTLYVIDVTRH